MSRINVIITPYKNPLKMSISIKRSPTFHNCATFIIKLSKKLFKSLSINDM